MSKIFETTVTSEEFPMKYLQVLNGTFRLTDKELELAATIIGKYMHFGKQGLREPFLSKFVFSAEERKNLRESLDNLSSQSLGNQLKQLLKKHVLGKEDTTLYLNPSLLPVSEITFKFVIDDTIREDAESSSEADGIE